MRLGQTILVAEDFDDIREILRVFLKARGFRVIETPDGEEAVDLAKQTSPDLILMDIGLETLDGLSATYKIRQVKALQRTPIIIISAHIDCRQAALEAGANEFLEKPVELDQLLDVLRRTLEVEFAEA